MDETPAVGIGGGAAVNPYKEYPLAEHHRQVLAEMIHRDKNHPCVVLWSLGNEPDLEHFPQDAYDYWHPLYELAHQLDPQNRPVTLVCCQNDYTKDITTRTMDIVCINRYYGWYNLSGDMDAACYGLNQELDFWAEQHKPVMMSEYGADTVAGLHTAGAEMFSEEFQVEFYRRLDAEFDKRPCLWENLSGTLQTTTPCRAPCGWMATKGPVHPGPPPQAGYALSAPAVGRDPYVWI